MQAAPLLSIRAIMLTVLSSISAEVKEPDCAGIRPG
jgi:hypothetical protein